MHLRITIVALVLGVLSSISLGAEEDQAKARKKLFEAKCSTCHGIRDYHLGKRSLKEWQLVVERMATYGGDEEDQWTDEEGDEIIAHLYLGKHEPLEPGEMYEYEKPTPVATSETQPATTSAPAVKAKRKLIISWRKSKTLWLAKDMGYVATGVMLLMVVSGLLRKKLKRNFRSIHIVLALLLFGALAIHASVYLCEYGAPNVMWLWSGIIASVLIGLVEFGGLFKRKLGARFIPVHSICGVVGLVLVSVHWFWTPITQMFK